jgi:hypothetical protein
MDPDLVMLHERLVGMCRELVLRLAREFDGGLLVMVGSVDTAAAAVELELKLARGQGADQQVAD